MYKKLIPVLLLIVTVFQAKTNCSAQQSPIDFEDGGNGGAWIWTTFENDTNPAVQIITNPAAGGINTSNKVAKFTALQAGKPWAGFESLHGGGIGTFTLDTTNSIIKVMVYKSVISDVGVKLVTQSSASTGELKVSNTVINQWEELTFDFTSQIGHPAMIGLDQIVIFPDFDLAGRTGDNVCYIDNVRLGNSAAPLSVKKIDNQDVGVFIGQNFIKVQSKGISTLDGIEVLDITGRTVFSLNEKVAANNKIDVQLNTNTLYFIRLRVGNNYKTIKSFIKN